jgi:hypothetical protein
MVSHGYLPLLHVPALQIISINMLPIVDKRVFFSFLLQSQMEVVNEAVSVFSIGEK